MWICLEHCGRQISFVLVAPNHKAWGTWYDGTDPDGLMEAIRHQALLLTLSH